MGEFLRKYWWTIVLWIAPIIIIGTTCQNWGLLAAIGTWLLAAGIFVAIWQIIETRRSTREQLEATRKSTNALIAVELFRELRNEKALPILRSIYNLKPQEDIATLSQGFKDNIDFVLDRLQLLGQLVHKGIIDKSLAIEGFGGPAILRCWFQLASYIHKVQEDRGFYVEDYEILANDCLKYFEDRDIKVNFRTSYIYIQDLVKELQKDKLRPRSLEEIQKARKSNNHK